MDEKRLADLFAKARRVAEQIGDEVYFTRVDQALMIEAIDQADRLTRERDLLAMECGAARKYRASLWQEAASFDSDGDWEAKRKEAAKLRGEAWAEWCDAKKANDAAGVKVEG